LDGQRADQLVDPAAKIRAARETENNGVAGATAKDTELLVCVRASDSFCPFGVDPLAAVTCSPPSLSVTVLIARYVMYTSSKVT